MDSRTGERPTLHAGCIRALKGNGRRLNFFTSLRIFTKFSIDKMGLVSIKYLLSMLDTVTLANYQKCGVKIFFIPFFFA